MADIRIFRAPIGGTVFRVARQTLEIAGYQPRRTWVLIPCSDSGMPLHNVEPFDVKRYSIEAPDAKTRDECERKLQAAGLPIINILPL